MGGWAPGRGRPRWAPSLRSETCVRWAMSRHPDDFLANLRTPLPRGRKLYLVARNNWIKIKTRSGCCGHHGEPGC